LAFYYWFDKPRFLTEGRLATVLIIPSSWGFQLGGYLPASAARQAMSSDEVAKQQTAMPKITMMVSVSNGFPRSKNTIASKFFLEISGKYSRKRTGAKKMSQ
jgi:hypothetical protein